jgi:long-chain acyl-CoA synthetase
MQRKMYADPTNLLVHDAVLESCRRTPAKTAVIDTSGTAPRCFSYGEYGDLVERTARGMVASGVRPGEVIGIYLPNWWEYAVVYHAATLAGATPTPLNPSYREREVRYQIEDSEAAALITDGVLIAGMDLTGLPSLRRVYAARTQAPSCEPLANLVQVTTTRLPDPVISSKETLAALPYSSGTTGLPKGVMLSHHNLVANAFQTLGNPDSPIFAAEEVVLCVLPLYHIYGLNVVLNPVLLRGATLVLVPRFDTAEVLRTILQFGVTMLPVVPPMLNAFCVAAEKGIFPRDHSVRWVKCGAAPLAPELAHRFTDLTGIRIRQGYGMTEASPVTHIGCLEEGPYRPESIGVPVAQTECMVLNDEGDEAAPGDAGELVMRGPQFMLGYWKSPAATAAALRDGWYWSGDVVRRDEDGLYYVVDRRKEMIKYKGFSVAPAEIESVLLEHPSVRDCGVVGKPDAVAGEIPAAFVVLKPECAESDKLKYELADFVAERLAHHKQPREIHFVPAIPHTPSGKILRRELRRAFSQAATDAS